MWQVRRGLNILHGATPETLKDLFAATSEVEKMDGMVQTLQSMLAVIEARKTVVEQREAARLAEAAVPAVQGTLSSFLLKPAHPIHVTSISEDARMQAAAMAATPSALNSTLCVECSMTWHPTWCKSAHPRAK